MNVTSTRVLQMFYILAINKKTISSQQLAEELGVSVRTVKNDISLLENFANENGAELNSKRGTGYWLNISNNEKFTQVLKTLDIRFNKMNYHKNTLNLHTRAHEIICNLIVKNDYIKLEELCEKMYISRSVLKNEIKEVRKSLEMYHLSLHSKSGYGLKITGDELLIRLCLVELYEIYYYSPDISFQSSEYLRFFEEDKKVRADYRLCFLTVLRNCNFRITDSFISRVVEFLIIQRHRVESGNNIYFDNEKKDLLKSLDEYKAACEIFLELSKAGYGFTENENEIFAIELLMLMWLDLCVDDNMEERYPYFTKISKEIIPLIVKEWRKNWNFDIAQLPNYKEELMSILIPIIVQITFELSSCKIKNIFIQNNIIHTSPVSMTIAFDMRKIIEKYFNCKLSEYLHNFIAVHVYSLIDEITYDYKPRNILIGSRNGMQASYIIRRKILRCFPIELFNKIDVYDVYEVRNIEKTEYDYLLLNFPSYSYKYEIPFMCVNQLVTRKQLELIYRNIILEGYELENLLLDFKFNNEHFFDNFEYESAKSFVNLVSYKNGKNFESINLLIKKINEVDDNCVKNGVLTILVNRNLTNDNRFELYRLQKTGIWKNSEIQYILFISANFDEKMKKIRFIEHITHELVEDTSKIDKMFSSKVFKEVIEVVKDSISIGSI